MFRSIQLGTENKLHKEIIHAAIQIMWLTCIRIQVDEIQPKNSSKKASHIIKKEEEQTYQSSQYMNYLVG